MNPNAIDQAKQRLTRAKHAIQALEKATSYADAESAWTDFLLATATIYSKLEQGAKGHGKSEAWFGRMKKQRRDDPLLRYLHYARNSDEHGVELVVERRPGDLAAMGPPLKFGERREYKAEIFDDNGKVVARNLNAIQLGPSIKLIRAHDSRFGDYCDPPTHHFGKKIAFHNLFPAKVGELAITYLEGLLSEAEAFSKAIAK